MPQLCFSSDKSNQFCEMALPFNIEMLKYHRFESGQLESSCSRAPHTYRLPPSDSHGDLLCPSGQCAMKLSPDVAEDGTHGLSLHQRQQIWSHVFSNHSDLFEEIHRAQEKKLISTYVPTNVKVGFFLFSLGDSPA